MMTVKIFRSVIVNGLYFLYYDCFFNAFYLVCFRKEEFDRKGQE